MTRQKHAKCSLLAISQKIRLFEYVPLAAVCFNYWGWIQVSREGGFEIETVGGSGDILPQKIFKIEVLGNGISNILRSSQRVIMSHFSI